MLIVFHRVFGTAGVPTTETQDRAAREERYVTPVFARESTGTHRTLSLAGQAPPELWPPGGSEPAGVDRLPIRLARRESMGVPAPRDGRRHNLLAAPARSATGGRVPESLRGSASASEGSGHNQLVPHRSLKRITRHRLSGAEDWAESNGSRSIREQTSHPHGPARRPLILHSDREQHPSRNATAALGGGYAFGAGQARKTAPSSR